MAAERKFTDNAGDDVLRFASAVRNLSRVGELTDEIVEMAESGRWRRYRTALGTDEWRECEFDFFLISCGLAWDDVSRVLAWSRKGEELMPFMDPSANDTKRRPFEEAAATWHSPGPGTLVDRARELGWTKGAGAAMRVPPVPPRARTRHAKGTTMDEHARVARQKRIPAQRRRELDALVKGVVGQTADEDEYRYVLDRLRNRLAGPGRQATTKKELEQWRQDAERLDWNTERLAERWGIALRSARRRVRRLRT